MSCNHSFLIPLFNEEENIAGTIATIDQAATVLSSYEIIVVDDASHDNSLNIVTKLSEGRNDLFVKRHEKNKGFARSYKTALESAQGESCQYIPSDNVIQVNDLIKILQAKLQAEVVFQYCLNPLERKPLRSFISRGYTQILNRIHKQNLSYYNGLNIYPRDFLLKQQFENDSFAFQAELAIAATKNLSYTQVGIRCQFKDDTSSAMAFTNVLKVITFLLQQLRRPQ